MNIIEINTCIRSQIKLVKTGSNQSRNGDSNQAGNSESNQVGNGGSNQVRKDDQHKTSNANDSARVG